MAVELANATLDTRVSICATRKRGLLSRRIKSHVTFVDLQREKKFDRAALLGLARFCRATNVDVIHVHGRSSFLLVALLKVVGVLPPVGLIAHDHYGDVETAPKLGILYRAALASLQPVYVGVHPQLTSLASRGVLRCQDARTIENAIDFSNYGTQRNSTDGPPKGVVVSNIRPSKDIALGLSAIAMLTEIPWSLSVAGEARGQYARYCLELSRNLGISGRVAFLGAVADVPDVLAGADFGLHSARSESGPLVLLEFCAVALPFVSTEVGVVARRLADAGVQGFVPPGDRAAMTTALRELLLLSPLERRARGLEAQTIATSLYDISLWMPHWYNAYEKALS